MVSWIIMGMPLVRSMEKSQWKWSGCSTEKSTEIWIWPRRQKNKQMQELQKYVENVRHLSDERDRLNTEFDKENEDLKAELRELKQKLLEEEEKITQMCHEEKIPELIGSSRQEQIAHLLVIRSNLLEKLEVTEKVKTKHYDLENQLHDLRSEDSELRARMNNAMAEMGGMANKLTEAVQERDRLKREVGQLNHTLNLVNGLPCQDVNNMDAKTQILALENSVNYYVGQIERLSAELEKCKNHNRTREAELMAELEDLREMNARFKDVNSELNKRLEAEGDKIPAKNATDPLTKRSTSVDSYLLPESQERLEVRSKKLISQMEAALQSENKKSEEQNRKHQDEMSRMKERIKELEEIIRKNEKMSQKDAPKISTIDFQELKAQLAETDRQYKVAKAEEAECREKCHKVERELAKAQASWKQCERQLGTQTSISFGLKQRNDELELELAKVITDLQASNEKRNKVEAERRKLENEVDQRKSENTELRDHVSDLKRNHDKEIRELKILRDQSTKLKSYVSSESQRVSELQVQLNEAQTRLEIEKGKRFSAEEDLESARFDLEAAIRKKKELLQEIDDYQITNESLENKLHMMSGRYEDIHGEKLVEEMSREQLEDITNVMRVRLMSSLDKTQNYAEKYMSLKRKHKAKIRKIRDLFMLERKATAEEVEKLDLRVMLAESALEQELSWKQKAIDDVRKAEEAQRKAIRREDEARKSAEGRSIELDEALSKYRNLSDENKKLLSQLDHLESQKHEIERLVRKEHQKKELNTLLSSLSLSGSLPQNKKKITASDTMALDESGFNETSTFQLEDIGSGERIPQLAVK